MTASYTTFTSLFDDAQKATQQGRNLICVMDPKEGDIRHEWDSSDDDDVIAARKLFERFTGAGRVAYRVGADGKKAEVMREFDPKAGGIVIAPALVGG